MTHVKSRSQEPTPRPAPDPRAEARRGSDHDPRTGTAAANANRVSEPASCDVPIGGDHLELLAAMGRDFASSQELDVALNRAVEHITRSCEAEGGALFLIEEDGHTLRCHACFGATDILGLTMESDQGIVGRCVGTNRGEVVRDAQSDPNFFRAIDDETGYTTCSILCAPMSVRDERIGAVELINKSEGRLFSPQDLHVLEVMTSAAALAIQSARQAEALVEQERVRRELELAREIQMSLLPKAPPETFPIRGVSHPAMEMSGDFYDYFSLTDGRIAFTLGDVAGKGLNAALTMAKTASLYRCLGKTNPSPGRLLAQINRELCETSTGGMFVTMVAGVYDPSAGTLTLANAGHEPPLLMLPDGTSRSFQAGAPPLGIVATAAADGGLPEETIELEGGTLWVFTDGLTEGFTETGGELGREGALDALTQSLGQGIDERLSALASKIVVRGDHLRDDLTVLAIDGGMGVENCPAAADPDEAGERILSVCVPACAERLQTIRQIVRSAVTASGATGAYLDDGSLAVDDVVLAVDEVCQNVIRHAYAGCSGGDIGIEMRYRADTGEFIVLLSDYAAPVDASKIGPRPLNDVRPGGLGTHFIQELMDDVRFVKPPSGVGNRLRLAKKIRSA